jgi:uncharacterized protein (TIGR02058 family)
MEILELKDMNQIEIEVLVAAPRPEEVDLERVKESVPIGQKNARAVSGGMMAQGLCVPQFGHCDQIVVVNAALTVFINQ